MPEVFFTAIAAGDPDVAMTLVNVAGVETSPLTLTVPETTAVIGLDRIAVTVPETTAVKAL